MDQNDRIQIVPGTDGKVTIRHGRQVDFFFDKHTYETASTDSLLRLIKRKGSAEWTIIACDEENSKVSVILDDTVMNRPQDTAVLAYEWDRDLADWLNILDRRLDQKTFVKFLQARPDAEKGDIEPLLNAASHLSVATEITGDYVHDDNQNTVFAFKSRGKEGTTKIPKSIKVLSPVVRDGQLLYSVEFEIELDLPKSADQKPAFIITCPKRNRYWYEAVKAEVKRIEEALPYHLVINGTAEAKHRTV